MSGSTFLALSIVQQPQRLGSIALLAVISAGLIIGTVSRIRNSRRFEFLSLAAVITGLVAAALHNVLLGIAEDLPRNASMYSLVAVSSELALALALVVCPIALAVGMIGMAVQRVRHRQDPG